MLKSTENPQQFQMPNNAMQCGVELLSNYLNRLLFVAKILEFFLYIGVLFVFGVCGPFDVSFLFLLRNVGISVRTKYIFMTEMQLLGWQAVCSYVFARKKSFVAQLGLKPYAPKARRIEKSS